MLKSFRTCCALASCFFLSAVSNAQGDWDQFQGNAQHTGVADSSINAPLLKSAWSASGTFESATVLNSGVAIVDGSVYATRLTNNWFVGPYVVSRYNGTNGAVTWSTSLASNGGYSAPSVAGNTVYVHKFGHSSTTPYQEFPALIGLASTTGSQQFRTNHEGQWSSGSRPTIQGNMILAAGGYYGGLDSYDLDGNQSWFHKVNQQYGWIPAANDTHAYVYMGSASASPGPSTGSLFIVNLATGVREATILDTASISTIYGLEQSVVLGGMNDALALTVTSYTGTQSLVSFDLVNNDVNWRASGAFSGSLALNNGLIYVPEGNQLKVIDQLTGSTAWTWNGIRNVFGNVVLTDDYAFVNANGSVHAIDLATRQSVWNSNRISGDIALDGNLLVISNQNGLFAFTAVPEPMSVVCLAAGIGAIGYRRFRKRISVAVKV